VDEAIALYQELIQQTELYVGTDHEIYLTLMQNLAGALNDNNQVRESIEILQAISPKMLEKYGTKSQAYISMRTTLANNLKSLKEFAAAETIYFEMIDLATLLYGENHSEVFLNQYNLAELYYESKRPQKTLELLEIQLPRAVEFLGQKHIISVYMLEAVAWSNHLIGNQDQAFTKMQEALELKKQIFGLESTVTKKAQEKFELVSASQNN